ncbi:MAG: OsmC family peroxiredoxin [Bacteroidota bacterium]
MITNNAKAKWQGKIKDGKGTMSLPTLGKEVSYTFSSRFENAKGTNPEELIAAAHAGCFSMALSELLTKQDFDPEYIETTVTVKLEMRDGTPVIYESEINTEAKVPGITEALFMKLAVDARENCPVSRALNVKKTMKVHVKQ